MASVTVTASCPASTFAGVKLSKAPAASANRVGIVVSQQPKGAVIRAQAGEAEALEKKSSSRRDLVFSGAAAAMFWSTISASGNANAEEPKRGSPEAKKIYAPVCVTMPTAKICRN